MFLSERAMCMCAQAKYGQKWPAQLHHWPESSKWLHATCPLCPSDRYKMCTVYRNRLCVQELSYIVDFNRLSTQNLLISHGTYKDTRNTQKISIQSKGASPPACTCTLSRGTASNEITLNTRILWINLCKILSICSYTVSKKTVPQKVKFHL